MKIDDSIYKNVKKRNLVQSGFSWRSAVAGGLAGAISNAVIYPIGLLIIMLYYINSCILTHIIIYN